MRENKSIPLLGIDERYNKRQKIPGIAKQLLGVRPNGLEESPNWVPIPNADELKNKANVSFSHNNASEQIVKLFWHIRSRVGKHGTDGSLKRLVVVFNTGVIELIDPDKDTAWMTVASYTVSSSDSGAWGASFTQMYNTGYLTITKGGVPQGDYFVEDDLIVPFIFPELPIMRSWNQRSEYSYTQEVLDSGDHRGFKHGKFFIRYAFCLPDGKLVKHSLPEIFLCSVYDQGDGTYKTTYPVLYMEGYGQTSVPSNFEYWKDKISGVTVLISEFSNEWFPKIEEDEEYLSKTVWFELATFDYIDVNEAEEDKRWKTITSNEDTFSTLAVANIDNGTHHIRSHAVCDTFNSRLMLGTEKVDFALPINQKESLYRNLIVKDSDGLKVTAENFSIHGCNVMVTNTSGSIRDINVSHKSHYILISYTSTGDWNARIEVKNKYAKSFYINVSNKDFSQVDSKSLERNVLDISNYVEITSSGSDDVALERVFQIDVCLETEYGNFTRYTEIFTAYTDKSGVWYPYGMIIGYPDNRVKKINVYANSVNSMFANRFSTRLHYSSEAKSSEKGNFSFLFLRTVQIFPLFRMSVALTYPPETGNQKILLSSNKVRASEVNSLLSYPSKLVYHIGNEYCRVTGFAVNALEVSQGQFGQYPLFVFKEDSIWALEQSSSAEVVFAKITPIETSIGVDNEEKIETISNVIFFATSKGIYQLAGTVPKRISEPVKSIHPNIQTLGSIRTDDDRELLVPVGSSTYRYSLKYRRWYQSQGNIHCFFKDVEHLYGLNDLGKIIDFETDSGTVVPMIIELEDIHFGQPDYLKRFFYFYLRGNLENASNYLYKVTLGGKDFETTCKKQLYPKVKSVTAASLLIKADNEVGQHHIESIDTEYSIRYKRKRVST
jgi:hypothetical protein